MQRKIPGNTCFSEYEYMGTLSRTDGEYLLIVMPQVKNPRDLSVILGPAFLYDTATKGHRIKCIMHMVDPHYVVRDVVYYSVFVVYIEAI